MKCPECNGLTKIPEGPEKLPVNWTVQRALDLPKSELLQSSSTAPASFPANICRVHGMPIILFCNDCSKLICATCLGNHSTHVASLGPIEHSVEAYCKQKSEMQDRVSKAYHDCEVRIKRVAEMRAQANSFFSRRTSAVSDIKSRVIDALNMREREMIAEIKESASHFELQLEHFALVLKENAFFLHTAKLKCFSSSSEDQGEESEEWEELDWKMLDEMKVTLQTYSDCLGNLEWPEISNLDARPIMEAVAKFGKSCEPKPSEGFPSFPSSSFSPSNFRPSVNWRENQPKIFPCYSPSAYEEPGLSQIARCALQSICGWHPYACYTHEQLRWLNMQDPHTHPIPRTGTTGNRAEAGFSSTLRSFGTSSASSSSAPSSTTPSPSAFPSQFNPQPPAKKTSVTPPSFSFQQRAQSAGPTASSHPKIGFTGFGGRLPGRSGRSASGASPTITTAQATSPKSGFAFGAFGKAASGGVSGGNPFSTKATSSTHQPAASHQATPTLSSSSSPNSSHHMMFGSAGATPTFGRSHASGVAEDLRNFQETWRRLMIDPAEEPKRSDTHSNDRNPQPSDVSPLAASSSVSSSSPSSQPSYPTSFGRSPTGTFPIPKK